MSEHLEKPKNTEKPKLGYLKSWKFRIAVLLVSLVVILAAVAWFILDTMTCGCQPNPESIPTMTAWAEARIQLTLTAAATPGS